MTLMKLHLDNAGEFKITAYAPGSIVINDRPYNGSLVIQVSEPPGPWNIQDITELDQSATQELLSLKPEVLLIGTGTRQKFPPLEHLRWLYSAEIGFEIMDTAAACRTFNIIAGEGRRVLAAVLALE